MTLMELMSARYSARDFLPDPVEEEKLARILEAGRIAPTAKNQQPWHGYVLQSEEALAKIRDLTRCAFNAPVVLMITVNHAEEWANAFEPDVRLGEVDCAIAATHMMLMATELGLGTCWVGYYPPTKVKEAFGLPEEEFPVLLMPLGYPSPEKGGPSPRHTQRKSIDELYTRL